MVSYKYPLGVYAAEHGLKWTYPVDAIGYAELDRCRTILGGLPDFDSGDTGYEGIAAVGGRVFVMRVFKVEQWDFKGRDSVYLAVTWFAARMKDGIDIERLLHASALNEPSHSPPEAFECATFGADVHLVDGERWRRPLEGGPWEKWVERPHEDGGASCTEKTETSVGVSVNGIDMEDVAGDVSNTCERCRRKRMWRAGVPWIVLLTVAVLAAVCGFGLFYNMTTKEKLHERSGECVVERKGNADTEVGGDVPCGKGTTGGVCGTSGAGTAPTRRIHGANGIRTRAK